MKKYGLPFQGSKSRLAERIVDLLPAASHLYDLFAGGCAVSHCALSSGKWGAVHINDITDSVELFDRALRGDIPDGSEWISREEFFRRKDTDPYVRLVWSFSHDQRTYLYGRHIEPYKKAVHEMIYAPTPNERRLKFKEVCRQLSQLLDNQGGGRWSDLENMERTKNIPVTRVRNARRACVPSPVSGIQPTPPYNPITSRQRPITGSVKSGGGQTDFSQRKEGTISESPHPFAEGSIG